MPRLSRLLVLACAACLALPAAAGAASQMYVGFQDDQSFRWAEDRATLLDQAAIAGTTIIRVTIDWSEAAPSRPANAANPFDPVYQLADVDEFVRNAQERGIEVIVTLWGVPSWANGGAGKNRMPRRVQDLRNFAKAVAARYSGRFSGYPFVGFYSVWNEPNLEQFLAPQFDQRGRSVAPALYAKLYRAAYAGVKAGNKKALVAVGETSPRGRDKPSPGVVQNSHSPGRFAELLSKTRPRIKFDAWAQHPYPTGLRARPTQRVRWPNVTLSQMSRFEQALDKWFGRENIPIWFTEYGHQTRPERSDGLSYAKQAAFAQQALKIARSDPRVKVFVWFILRDSVVENKAWEGAGGLISRDGGFKPGLGRFAVIARQVDVRNAQFSFRAGTFSPRLEVPVLELKAHNDTGATIRVNYSLIDNGRLVGNVLATAPIATDGRVTFRPDFVVRRGHRYVIDAVLTDDHGNSVVRKLDILGF